jgi:hypothetical protein
MMMNLKKRINEEVIELESDIILSMLTYILMMLLAKSLTLHF